jgi:hypothetical protein
VPTWDISSTPDLVDSSSRTGLSEAFDSPGSVFFPLKIEEVIYKDASRNG